MTDRSSSRPADRPRVWAEAGATIAVTDQPPQFVRFSFGAEHSAPSGSKKDLKKAEERLYAFCEEVVEERLRAMSELVMELWEERHEELRERLADQDSYPYS